MATIQDTINLLDSVDLLDGGTAPDIAPLIGSPDDSPAPQNSDALTTGTATYFELLPDSGQVVTGGETYAVQQFDVQYYALPSTAALQNQVTFLSGVTSGGLISQTSFGAWQTDPSPTNPAVYNTTQIAAGKWATSNAPRAGQGAGTVNYYFDAASVWNNIEKSMFTASLALWSAVANINLVEATTPDENTMMKITRGANGSGAFAQPSYGSNEGAGGAGSEKLYRISKANINIETAGGSFGPLDGSFTTKGGDAWHTLIHEVGHALGLGHGGPYNSNVDITTQQFNEYDFGLWTVMSYINPNQTNAGQAENLAKFYNQYPVTGTNWGVTRVPQGGGSFQIYNNGATTMMPLDIAAIQRLYGTPTSTPFSGGQTYGFNTNIATSVRNFYDFTVNTQPVVTIWNAGTNNTLDVSGFGSNSTINLNPGTFSSAGTSVNSSGNTISLVKNIGIAYDTAIDRLYTGIGNDNVMGNDNANFIFGGIGTNTMNGAGGSDTAAYAQARNVYTITANPNGSLTVTGGGTADTLQNFEFLQFADQTIATNSFNTQINGTPGNDTLAATAGNDDIDGLGGTDTVTYQAGTSAVTVSLATSDFQNTGGSGSDRIVNVENLTGTQYNDTLTGNDGDNEIYGFGGVDIINAGGGNDIIRGVWAGGQIDGGAGHDHLRLERFGAAPVIITFTPGIRNTLSDGTSFINIESLSVESGTGDDIVTFNGPFTVGSTPSFSAYGYDFWSAATGYDTLKLDLSQYSEMMYFSYNSNTTFFSRQADQMSPPITFLAVTDVESFHVTGGSGNDRFEGGPNSDILQGGAGDDIINGGSGFDTASYTNAPSGVTVDLALGVAQNTGAAGTDTLISIEALTGSAFNDTLLGSNSDNLFTGNGGINIIDGRGGVDIANYAGTFSAYSIALNPNGTVSVMGNGTADTLTSIEELRFSDISASVSILARAKAGDFNADGKSDFLWQNDNGQASIWLMNGAAVMSTPVLNPNPGPAWHIKGAGDFSGDGKADILWQNKNGQASLWLMNGASILATPVLSPNPSKAWHIKGAGDFNGDGKSDILWQNDDGQASVWLMDGASILATPVLANNPGTSWRIKGSGDFNGDGKSDILWQNANGQASIWMMNGASVLATPVLAPIPGAAWQIKGSADFNGDGKGDILWQNDDGQASVWLMDGASILSLPVLGPSPGVAWHIRGSGDFNGDTKSDILWQNENGQASTWLMNGTTVISASLQDPNPGTSWKLKGPAEFNRAPSSDFNGDGRSDLLFQNDNGQTSIWIMNADMPLSINVLNPNPGPAWRTKGAGDFNGDGKSDILWQNDNGQVSIWLMNGASLLATPVLTPNPGPEWRVKGSGDFNGDGKSDILWQNNNGQASIWLMDGPTVLAMPVMALNPGPEWQIKGSGDFDGDGKSDILWQNTNGQASIWLMDGPNVLSTPVMPLNPGRGWHIKGSGDFDGDGKSDILWQNDNGEASIWLMDGPTVRAMPVMALNPGPAWRIQGAGDFAGEGKSDILWQNVDGQVSIWTMAGSSVLSMSVLPQNPGVAWHISA